jgi:hypothetical protein
VKALALLLVLATGCLDGTPFKTITVTGVVTDTTTGAPIPRAGVQVLFGLCDVSCAFQGSPGTGPTDSLGRYTVQIDGPSGGSCGGYGYFVHVDAGSGYTPGDGAFACGPLTSRLDFALHPVQPYTISGTITHISGGSGIQGATVLVGLYPIGTSCLDPTSCVATALDSTTTSASGAYSLTFLSVATPGECAGNDFLVTVRTEPGFTGGEGHVPCGIRNLNGTLTATLNLKLPP